MEREVRYCTSEDGVRIAYTVEGTGPPLMVCPAAFESFSLHHLVPPLQEFVARLGKGRTLVLFDTRGTGLSQREADDYAWPTHAADMHAVAEASSLGKFALWAGTLSGPPAIEYAARYPDSLTHLILYGTFARVEGAYPADSMRSFGSLAASNWDQAAQLFADMNGRREFAEETAQLAECFQQSTTGAVAAKRIEQNAASDCTDLLSEIRTPTLVLHRVNDPIHPLELSRDMAARIPDARLVTLPGRAHLAALGDPDSVIDAVDAFLGDRGDAQKTETTVPSPSAFRTVLFTDVVGHTEMMARLGDAKGREVLREHEDITREVLRVHGGTEVKTMGDGFMASFTSVVKAVDCAIALQRAFAERNQSASELLQVRVGLNAGEPIEEDSPDGRTDLFGETVILASRIAAAAEGGEVLASLAVRELCAGKGFLFADAGAHAMRGFEDPVRVFAVKWQS
ncbi:MAG TPA: adenylate/guanylate cyclase domain-containing protein [Dehalococcoidia bacterium]